MCEWSGLLGWSSCGGRVVWGVAAFYESLLRPPCSYTPSHVIRNAGGCTVGLIYTYPAICTSPTCTSSTITHCPQHPALDQFVPSLSTLHSSLHFRSAARVRVLRATQLSPSGAPSLRGRSTRCVNWCEGKCGHCEDCTCLCPFRSRTVGCTVIICVCKCCWMGCGSSYDMTPHPSLPPSIITTLIHALSLVIPLTPIRTGVAGWGVAQHEPRRHVRRGQR